MTIDDLALRLAASFAAGLVLGLEREKRGRAAGLRTTALVCVAAAVAMMLSEALPATNGLPAGTFGGDPVRLAAGVLTGMGFLGAGVIIRQDTLVRGVTTAAVVWTACIIGLAFGSGQFVLGAAGLGLTMVVLFLLPLVERRMDNDGYVTLTIVCDQPGPGVAAVEAVLMANQLRILTTSVAHDASEVTIGVHATAPSRDRLELPDTVTRTLRSLPGVRSAGWVG